MAHRVDALGSERRLPAVGSAIYDVDLDGQLQDIVKRAAEELEVPIALVSLVLDRIQFFKAHYGLPPDLAVSRATDRDASFCQFVVRDRAPLVESDARLNADLPQDLVDRYGIRAYAGIPLEVEGEVLGTLCVIDVAPRSFTQSQTEKLTELARVATTRLTQLATQLRAGRLIEEATRTSTAELRNLLFPLQMELAAGQLAATELAPLVALQERLAGGEDVEQWIQGLGALSGASQALDDLRRALTAMESLVPQLTAQTLALQHALHSGTGEPLREVLEEAFTVSRHMTRNVGGCRVEGTVPDVRVAVVGASGIATVAASLNLMSAVVGPSDHGIEARAETQAEHAAVSVFLSHPRLDDAAGQDLSRDLRRMAGPSVGIRLDRQTLILQFPIARG